MEISFGERELDVMGVLWELGSGTVAEVRDALPAALAYTTVLTILRNLEAKGLVRHEGEGKAHRYFAVVARTAARRSALARMVERLFHGSPEALVAQLVHDRGLDAAELERLSRALRDEQAHEQAHERDRRALAGGGAMIALVMLAACLAAAALAAGAWAAERTARLWRRPTRWVWGAALLAAALAPAWSLAPRVPARPARAAAPVAPSTVRLPTLVVRANGALDAMRARLGPRVGRVLARADRPLALAWALSSALALATLAAAHLRLRRRARAWPRTVVDGIPVRVAPDLGPAVVGVRRTEIVLDEWTLAMEAPLRALVLRHEVEHVRGGDARLLAAAALLIAAMPWNAPLRWLAHRLRLAIEVDCDARVLRAHPDVRRYGLLLLTVAQRAAEGRPTRTLLAPAALAEPLTDLERRITVMRAPVATHRVPRTVLLAAGALLSVGGFALACATPEAVSGTQGRPGSAPKVGVLELDSMVVTPNGRRMAPMPNAVRVDQPPVVAPPQQMKSTDVFFEFQVEAPVRQLPTSSGPTYPAAARTEQREGEVLAQFVVDTAGLVVPGTYKVLRAIGGDEFVVAVREGLPSLRFEPARVGGRKVKQLVQQPFQFALSK